MPQNTLLMVVSCYATSLSYHYLLNSFTCGCFLDTGRPKGVFEYTNLSDAGIGILLLILSLVALCICLLTMVKVLQSLMKGGVAKVIKKVINSKFPYPFGWVAGKLDLNIEKC